MKIKLNLQIEQSQKLTMTPQLQQAIQILQFTSLELEQYINEQLEQNPVLEKSMEAGELSDVKPGENETKEIDWEEYTENFSKSNYTGSSYHDEGDEFNYESFVSKEATLQENLLFQYNLITLDKKHMDIGEYIIVNIDDRGYFAATVEEVADYFNEKQSTVENILQTIQTLDPPGVGARTLEECLIIQLRLLGIEDEKLYTLIEKYLHDIASHKYPYIAKQLNVTVKEVQNYCDFIKTLEPKPGRNFAQDETGYITPDVIIKKIGKEYVILNNDYNSPRLIIRNDYKKIMNSNDKNSEVNKFLGKQFNSATWLIRSIEQRRRTIYKICEVIMEKQIDFFEKGKKHLKPMTLKEVADETEVHESTVSRAVNGKYMDTPLGVFELKYFFTDGVENDSGEGVSSESIKIFIKDIIDMEDCRKPLSDRKIVDMLKDKGIDISRRTVAKYRNELGILSSQGRRRY